MSTPRPRPRQTFTLLLASTVPVLLFAGAGCSPGSPAEEPVPVQVEMRGHFFEATELQTGAIFGDLERLRAAGSRLRSALRITILPPRSESHLADLRVAAGGAADALDAAEGRRAAAGVVRSCGSCHQQFQVGPGFVIGDAPEGESLSRHMARQERISRLLWAGLIGPSNDHWNEGASELTQEPPFPREIASRVQDSQLLDAAQSELRSLGRDAERVTTSEDRARVLAQVWGVCAGCHQLAGSIGP